MIQFNVTSTYGAGSELRWTADAYDQAQRTRIQAGERIRALVQGRDVAPGIRDDAVDADEILEQIRKGNSQGPVEILGRTYRRSWEAEQEAQRFLKEMLQDHPVWPWLSQIRGIGPVLAGKLLARLNPERADTPSSFWSYCGLATVPGVQYGCHVCGFQVAYAVRFKVSAEHTMRGGKRACTGRLERERGPEEGVRVAQPKPARGESACYDREAKRICYLIGTCFLRSGGPYAMWYRATKEKLTRERPGWAPARLHLTAMRKMEKLFLSHLWLVWRESVGLAVTAPYAHQIQGHTSYIDPWQMVGMSGNDDVASIAQATGEHHSPSAVAS